jgi:hypothetical protein
MLRNEPPLAGSQDELWVGKLIVTVLEYKDELLSLIGSDNLQ